MTKKDAQSTDILEKIREHIEHPQELEPLYRADKKGFKEAFCELYPQIADSKMAAFWQARLCYGQTDEKTQKKELTELWQLLFTCLVSGVLVHIPQIFGFDPHPFLFYLKNAGLIVFFSMGLYTFLVERVHKPKQTLLVLGIFLISALYVNLLPNDRKQDAITLALIHLPLFLWCLYGFVYMGFGPGDRAKRMNYLKYNGDLAVLGAVILMAGGALVGLSIGLFSAIGLSVEKFYFNYIILWGLVAAPPVTAYVLRKYPMLSNKMAPAIARIFSPLVLLTLVVYLISIPLAGKDLYRDRDFLLIFNLMLLGVMAIIVFSIAETSFQKQRPWHKIILFALAVVTLVIDTIALSAILFRLGSYGFTPNRIAVLGSNLLIFGNLLLLMIDLFGAVFRHRDRQSLETTMAKYLPIYGIWTVFMVFCLPWLCRL